MVAASLSLLDSARWLGRCAWAEGRAFETLGQWSTDELAPAARVLFAAHSSHHGWRAELARDRLPQLADRSPSDFIDPGNPTLATVFDDLARTPATSDRLVVAYSVLLPELIAAYTRHAGDLSPGDATTARLLRILTTDVEEDRAEGQQLLQLLVSSPQDVADAARTQKRLTDSLLDEGGILGLNRAF
jgi:hypothetical protein